MKINVSERIGNSKFNNYFLGVFSLCAATMVADGYDLNTFGVVTPKLIDDAGMNPTQVGLLASCGLAGLVIGSFIFGTIADKIGRKKTILFCMCVYCAFTGLIGFSRGYMDFAVMRFIAGLGLAGVVPNVVSAITEYTPKSHRIRFASMSTVGIPVGTVLAAGVGILVLSHYSWRVMFWLAFLEVILIGLVAMYMPETMTKLVERSDKKGIAKILEKADPEYVYAEDHVFETDVPQSEKFSIGCLFQKSYAANTFLFWIAMFMNLYVNFGSQTWLPKLMMMQGYDLGSSLKLLLIFNLGALAGVIVGGAIASRIGYKKTILGFFAVQVILIGLLSLISNIFLISVLLFFAGAGVMGMQGMLNSYIAQCHPLNIRTTAVGWAFGVGRIGAVVAPIIGGFFIALNVPMVVNYLVFSFAGLIGFIAIALSKDYSK